MHLVKLIHPRLGICAEQMVISNYAEEKLKTIWKYKYGKKYYECSIEADNAWDVDFANTYNISFVKPQGRTRVTPAVICEVLRLIKKGYEYKIIKLKVGLSESTICRINTNRKIDTKGNVTQYYEQKLTA